MRKLVRIWSWIFTPAGLIATIFAFSAISFIGASEQELLGVSVGGKIANILFLFTVYWLLPFWAARKAARAHPNSCFIAGLIATFCAVVVFLLIGFLGAFGPPDPKGFHAQTFITFVGTVWVAIFGVICWAWAA